MSPDFNNYSSEALVAAAQSIGWDIDLAVVNRNKSDFAERLTFQYRWRYELGEIAKKAGGLSPGELPEFPFNAESIQECVGKLQPKIRRQNQKSWGWLLVFLVAPIFMSARCVLVNQDLLEAQTEELHNQLLVLHAQAAEQGWEMTVPEQPVWSDIQKQETILQQHREYEPIILSVMRQAREMRVKLSIPKPYTPKRSGDYSTWLKLSGELNVSSEPFALLKVDAGKVILQDESIQQTAYILHDLWAMNKPVTPSFINNISPEMTEASNGVLWTDAVLFANALSELLEYPLCYAFDDNKREWTWSDPECTGFRLPTEAEWIHINKELQESDSDWHQSGSEWCWDMYDPSWLWNISSGLDNPVIEHVNIADPTHVLRSGINQRSAGNQSRSSFKLVRKVQDSL